MKQIVVLVLITSLSLLYACKQSPEEMIVGDWQLSDVETNQHIPDADMEVYKQAIENMKASTRMTLKSDKTYESTINGVTTKGQWELNVEENLVRFIDETGSKVDLHLKELSENKLTFEEEEDGTISKLTFVK